MQSPIATGFLKKRENIINYPLKLSGNTRVGRILNRPIIMELTLKNSKSMRGIKKIQMAKVIPLV